MKLRISHENRVFDMYNLKVISSVTCFCPMLVVKTQVFPSFIESGRLKVRSFGWEMDDWFMSHATHLHPPLFRMCVDFAFVCVCCALTCG